VNDDALKRLKFGPFFLLLDDLDFRRYGCFHYYIRFP
jgi:hypothetical protein